ncbi:hypothetical protein ACFVUP_38550 [Streptomyces bacillaris]|uniref:hypothetical protein n=1 Tax=Streptomyces bacillaris TaxID=68179 RepID=UPI0036DDFC32
MTENTRGSEDGFKGDYPRSDRSWLEELYREAGMTPPWLLEYKDGKVVGERDRSGGEAPRHEA